MSLMLFIHNEMRPKTTKKKDSYITMEEITIWKEKTGILYNDTRPIERDVAQLGSAFVLGTKCHRFKSCHPYLSFDYYFFYEQVINWDRLKLDIIFHLMPYIIVACNVFGWGYKKNPFR